MDENQTKLTSLEDRIKQGYTNLTAEQLRLWFLNSLGSYFPMNRVVQYELNADMDLAILQQSVSSVINNFPILDSVFINIQGCPLYKSNPNSKIDVNYIGEEKEFNFEKFLKEELNYYFNFEKGPLYKITLIRLETKKYYLVLTISQLISDRVTGTLFAKAVLQKYIDFSNNDLNVNLQEIQSSFSSDRLTMNKQSSLELYQAEKVWLQSPEKQKQINFWKSKLDNLENLSLPLDYERPLIMDHVNDSMNYSFEKDLCDQIKEFVETRNIEYKQFFLSLYFILLSFYSEQTDFAIGIFTDRRIDVKNKDLFGPLENLVPFRFHLIENESFSSLLERISRQVSQEKEYALLPFKLLLENISIARNLSLPPIFQVIYSFEDFQQNKVRNEDLYAHQVPLIKDNTAVDLTFNCFITHHGIQIRIDYNINLFSKATINKFILHFRNLVSSVLSNPFQTLSSQMIIDEAEIKEIMDYSVSPAKEIPNRSLHELVEYQVQKTPQHIAVQCQGEKLRYIELDEMSNQLANHLKSLNLGSEGNIALFLDRSIEVIIAQLAILKSGLAFLFIDPEYPNARIKYMLEDSNVLAVITHKNYVNRLDLQDRPYILIDEDWVNISKKPRIKLEKSTSPDSPAYVIYTSGTTGDPKAVRLTHRGIVNNLLWRQTEWPLTAEDRVLQNSSFSFDPSVWAVFWPLITGATTIITPSKYQNDTHAIIKLIKEEKITLIGTVPSLIALMMEDPEIGLCDSLKVILSGGEALSSSLLQKIFGRSKARVSNLYGPTETTIDATCYHCTQDKVQNVIPIGKPITNQQVYILDKNMNIVPFGIKGEIYIGGQGVALGYYNRPSLTESRFIKDPFKNDSNKKLYRTGDFGRLQSDGNVIFLGRTDEQVKIRGFRIEVNEIEVVINKHPNIQETAVAVHNDDENDPTLIAYIVTKDQQSFSYKDFISYFSSILPKYMLPNDVINLQELPKNSNGKLDRKKLPSYFRKKNHEPVNKVLPSSGMGQVVAQFFCEVLGLSNIEVQEDFFELGGTSLMLTRLASMLFKRFDVSIPLHQFFKVPTVSGVVDVIITYQQDGLDAVMKQKHATKLEEDAKLDADISPVNLPWADFLKPSNCFLTGATGYLGSFLLQQLLEQSNATIYCHVRAKSHKAAFERLEKTMRAYRIWKEEYNKRIIPVLGDLALPRIGIIDEEWDTLASIIDVIYHCGALVNFAFPYSALRAANVLSINELLRLSCSKQLKAFHYISTIDVLLATHTPRPFIEDDTPLRKFSDIPGGYTGSKWVSEKIVYLAKERGIPVSIYRPGLIMSHSETGATQTNDYILVAFRGFAPMGIIPEYQRIFDIVPVDYVAKAITYISLKERPIGKFYHLFNPKPAPFNQFCEWIRTYGYNFKIVPFEMGRKKALEVDQNHPLYPLVPLIRDADPLPQRSLDPKYMHEVQCELDCANSLIALSDSDIVCPPVNEHLVHLCLEYLIQIGFLPNPTEKPIGQKAISTALVE